METIRIDGRDCPEDFYSSGDVACLYASQRGVIRHTGSAEQIVAQSRGRVTAANVTGKVVVGSEAEVVFAGSPHTVSLSGGSRGVVVGSPNKLTVSSAATAIVFGSPKKVYAYESAKITLVPDIHEYLPTECYGTGRIDLVHQDLFRMGRLQLPEEIINSYYQATPVMKNDYELDRFRAIIDSARNQRLL